MIYLERALKEIRKKCLQISCLGKDANLQSIFSSLEIMWTLYHGVLNWSVDLCQDSNRDLFVLSKGQSTLGLHVILEELNLFQWKELKGFCTYNSRFSMQADRTKFQGGIEVSAGSLGHGYPMAVGIAMANKIKKLPSKVYVLAGDGEMNEGTMWEACLLAAHKKLDNLCLIIDNNDSIGKMVTMEPLPEKLESFGFQTFEVNGHNIDELNQVLKQSCQDKPTAIIAQTQRGYGSKTLMEHNEWFHKAPSEEELQMLLREVDDFEKAYDSGSK